MAALTAAEVAAYRRDGYVLYRRKLFSQEKMDHLRSIFEDHLASKGERLSDELDTPHFRDPRLLAFLLSDEVLDLVEPIIGPDIALFSSHFICKDPYSGRATPWHEDSAYWKRELSAFDNVVTVWLALDRSTKENGCMRVIPGSHHNGFSEYVPVDRAHHTFSSQITSVDESKAVDCELEAGQCSLHDARIIHGAAANTSPLRRCGYTMRYIPTSVKVYLEQNPGFKIWLARGKDVAGNAYANVP